MDTYLSVIQILPMEFNARSQILSIFYHKELFLERSPQELHGEEERNKRNQSESFMHIET